MANDLTKTPTHQAQTKRPLNQHDNEALSPYVIFSILLIPRLLAAQYSIIGDCDEVFNYWEPTHYLVHGNGFQTWEYSPVYAIRSWAYIAIHAAVIKVLELLQFAKFYGLRVLFAFVTTYCETLLVYYVQKYRTPEMAKYLILLLFANAGMFVASTAYLPSTFAMYGVTLSHAFSFKPPSKLRTIQMFTAIGITSIFSWPFAAVTACVLFAHDVLEMKWTKTKLREFIEASTVAGAYVASFLAVMVAIDSMAYRRLQVVPINIVTYNVFSGEGRGPNIFGTEPWWYYILNLALYFNIAVVAAFASIPLIIIRVPFIPKELRKFSLKQDLTLGTIFLWLGIFILQPHKEERFMYVIYPLICNNAAYSIHALTETTRVLLRRKVRESRIRIMTIILQTIIFAVYAVLSLARILAQLRAYEAPMQIYHGLESSSNICLGKEWYRFPSSFFIPEGSQALLVKSAFDGLLPGKFHDSDDSGWRSGTWRIPSGMNDQNLEELSHLAPITQCDYLVDSDFPTRYTDNDTLSSSFEPRYSIMSDQWSRVNCKRFLDAGHSGLFGRAFWLPISEFDRSGATQGVHHLEAGQAHHQNYDHAEGRSQPAADLF